MGRSQETFSKKEKEKLKQKKRKEKEQKKEDRKAEGKKSWEDMMAYVDEFGNITSTPPDPLKKTIINAEDINIGVPKREMEEEQGGVRAGTVTFFNAAKGYGFIKDDITKESLFVHSTGLVDNIKDNDKVNYESEMGQKGPQAVNVKLKT